MSMIFPSLWQPDCENPGKIGFCVSIIKILRFATNDGKEQQRRRLSPALLFISGGR
jgi:hypothetical protein